MHMIYRLLGSSGLRVSELCLGAMTFGEESGIGAGEAESRRVFDRYLEAGGNFIDTANIYNRGTSERMLAGFIRGHRDALVLASKYTMNTRADDPNAGGSHRKNLVQALEASLRRLDTPYIDLYWIHGWDRHTALPEVLRALDDQVRLGKILHIGISNAPAWIVSHGQTLARERDWTPFTALQLHYNLVERSIEPDFLPMAQAFDIAVTAWSPLSGGLLSGKYTRPGQEAGRLGGPRGARTLTPGKLAAAKGLDAVADRLGCPSAALALAWMMRRRRPAVIPIIGARTVAQLEENLAALELEPGDADLAELDALAPPPPGYPESLLSGEFMQGLMYGDVHDRIDPAGG